jgi:NAD(P)H-hydrate epimerase
MIAEQHNVRYDTHQMRNPDSHKGENGKVAIIGGSRFIHGAPIFSALAAEASGVDLIFLMVPPEHEEAAKQHSLNFQVRTFKETELSTKDVGPILQLFASIDCAVIGPGLDRSPATLNTIRQIITGAPCPIVLDASALQPETLEWVRGKSAVLTPHLGELERMKVDADHLTDVATAYGVTILLKGPTDVIAGPDGSLKNSDGGNAGLTVGGTGDALTGLVAGLIAQGMKPQEAAYAASQTIKKAGDALFEKQKHSYTTRDVIGMIPFIS